MFWLLDLGYSNGSFVEGFDNTYDLLDIADGAGNLLRGSIIY